MNICAAQSIRSTFSQCANNLDSPITAAAVDIDTPGARSGYNIIQSKHHHCICASRFTYVCQLKALFGREMVTHRTDGRQAMRKRDRDAVIRWLGCVGLDVSASRWTALQTAYVESGLSWNGFRNESAGWLACRHRVSECVRVWAPAGARLDVHDNPDCGHALLRCACV